MSHRVPAPRFLVMTAIAAVTAIAIGGGTSAGAAQSPVGLGAAASFAVLSGTTVTNTGPTVVSGDLGVSPGSAITGFPPGTVNNGSMHAADALAGQAQAAVTTAYNDAAGRGPATPIVGDLGGQTLVAGVYSGGAIGLTGAVTLDGQGDPAAVFVFQAASTLITGAGSSVNLIGGLSACNIFWQVTSSATLGTTSTFAGTILALTSVTANTGASVAGRLLARNGAVTLDANTISSSACAAAAPTTTSTSSTTSTSTTTTRPTSTTTSTTTPVVGATTSTTFVGGAVNTTTTLSGGSSIIELPRTGSAAADLARAGFAAVILGGLLLAASRRTRLG